MKFFEKASQENVKSKYPGKAAPPFFIAAGAGILGEFIAKEIEA